MKPELPVAHLQTCVLHVSNIILSNNRQTYVFSFYLWLIVLRGSVI